MDNKKIFMTGASGFIGTYLLEILLENGYTVIAPTRSLSSKYKLSHNNLKWINNCNLNKIKTEYLKDCNSVIHLASHCPNAPYDNLDKYIRINCLDTLHFLNKSIGLGIDKFLIAGSAFEYGESSNNFIFIPTNAPLIPVGAYSTSKVLSFYMIKELCRLNNIGISYQRIFQVFGDGENENRFWPSLRRAAINGEDFHMSKGNQIRDFIKVNEVAQELFDAHEKLLEKSNNFVVENIGTGKGTKLKSFAEFWWKKFGAQGNLITGKKEIRVTDFKRIVADISK